MTVTAEELFKLSEGDAISLEKLEQSELNTTVYRYASVRVRSMKYLRLKNVRLLRLSSDLSSDRYGTEYAYIALSETEGSYLGRALKRMAKASVPLMNALEAKPLAMCKSNQPSDETDDQDETLVQCSVKLHKQFAVYVEQDKYMPTALLADSSLTGELCFELRVSGPL
eukprot:599278-Amphidinium_carterae.2